MNVSTDQIEKLMEERRAAGRAEVEKNEPPEPEQPPTPAPEEKAAGEKGPAVAARPKLIRRPRTGPRPNLETKCPKARGPRPPR